MNIEEILKYIGQWIAHLARDALIQVFTLIVMIEWGRIPWWHWPMVVAALAYFISPIDAMPDLIFVDDAAVLAGAVAALGGAVTDDVRAEAARRVDNFLNIHA